MRYKTSKGRSINALLGFTYCNNLHVRNPNIYLHGIVNTRITVYIIEYWKLLPTEFTWFNTTSLEKKTDILVILTYNLKIAQI